MIAGRRSIRVAIVGAGLGGTTAAILLHRAGFDVRVYEQATGLVRIGAGINMDPQTMRIMRRLGIEQRLIDIGRASETRQSRDWDTGEVTFEVPVARYPELYGGCHFSIHRGDLQEILAATVAPGIVQLGKRLTDLAETSSGVRLAFADDSAVEADFVIGADGINSKIREVLLGPERLIYTGGVAYRAVFPSARLGDLRQADHVKWWADDRYLITYFLTRARDEFYFMTLVQEPDWGSPDFAPQRGDLARMVAHFAGFHPDVQRILAAAPRAVRWPICARKPFPFWSQGRIVMLGDACHPMAPHMGQGAAMAIEDAVVLSRCIDAMGEADHRRAFGLYESLRYERASKVQSESLRNRWLRYPMDPGWVFNYDPFAVPLAGTPAQINGAA
ncbi:MAG: FAD-dependent monooxygenase [Alphaproteobacteria bacterium]|nr:FAD-dependent monooxygenase [Alphaproteobacteria bacterium]